METSELLKIWEENDREMYTEEAFEAIKQILKERNNKLPVQKKQKENNNYSFWEFDFNTGKDTFRKKFQEGYKWKDQNEFYSDFSNSLMGKRDAWAWVYGLIVPSIAIILTIMQLKEMSKMSIPKYILNAFYSYHEISIVIICFISLFYFFGKLWARKAMYAIPFILALIFYLTMDGKLRSDAISDVIARIIGFSIIGLIIYFFASQSVGNRAFFRIPISNIEVKKYWMSKSNNQAILSAWLALLFPLLIGGGVFPLLQSITGFELSRLMWSIVSSCLMISGVFFIIRLAINARKKVNYDAVPPIGGERYANIAIILTSIWVLILLYFVGYSLIDG